MPGRTASSSASAPQERGAVGGVAHVGLRRRAARGGASASSKRATCSAVSRSSALVGAGEVRHEPADAHLGVVARASRRAPASACMVTPRRAMPVSTLRWTSIGPLAIPARTRRANAFDLPERRGRPGTRPRAMTSSCGLAVVAAHDQDGRDDARLAELDALFEERDAEAVDPAVALERARDRGRAVPVAVGLEHGPDRGQSPRWPARRPAGCAAGPRG